MQLSKVGSGICFFSSVRLVITLGLVFALGFGSFPLHGVQADAMTLFVSPTGGATDCSESNPCAFGAALSIAATDGFTIQMDPGIYHGYGFQILHGVTIQGPTIAPGADPLVILDGTIDQDHSGRVLDIYPESKTNVNLQFLTIQNGEVTSGNGAGIRCGNAALSLNTVLVHGNTTTGDGGGIYSNGCNLSIVNSRIENNTATGWGGGINVSNNSIGTTPVVIMDSIIHNNTSNGNGGGGICIGDYAAANLDRVILSGNHAGRGAGIFAGAEVGFPLNLTDVAIYGNVAETGSGGGIHTYRTTTLTTVTISGNSASSGGGIFGDADALWKADLTLNHVTLAANNATNGDGTGVNLYTTGINSASMIARNTIFAGPAGKAVCAGATGNINSQGKNINTDTSCQLKPNLGNGDLQITNPNLGPLQDNGGSTYTHALLPGSPAINIANATSTNHDQRGFAYNGTPDVGAFEVLLPAEIELFHQYAQPFTVGQGTALYIAVNNPNATPSTQSNLSFTLTLPANLILGNPVLADNAQLCGGTITANPGERNFQFSGGKNGLTAPESDCWIELNVQAAAVGSGFVTATGATSLEAGTGQPPTPLEYVVAQTYIYLPALIR